MSYESYERKILKIKKIRDTILKYKYLILAIVIAISATVCGLLGVKGIFTKGLDLNASYVYGEELTLNANAILADVRYEYREKGGDWTPFSPDMPGEYEVRAAAKRGFGGENYTEPHSFRITPKTATIKILDSTIIYGENPTIGVSGLIKGDELATKTLAFEFMDETTSAPKAAIDVATFKITDAQGKDKTRAYDFGDRLYESIPLTLQKRPLEITFGSAEQYYDGTTLTCEEWSYTDGSLAFADRAEFVDFTDRVEVGTVDNLAQATVINDEGIDVTSLYDLTLIQGSLEVKRRPLNVSTDSAEKIYDGAALEHLKFSTEEVVEGIGLLDGHYLEITGSSQITDVGSVDNVLSFKVRNREGGDVGNCYQLTTTYGLLTVAPRPITIQPAEDQKLYNGKAYTSVLANITSEYNIVDGESLSVEVLTRDLDGNDVEAIDVGKYTGYIASYSIVDTASGIDKTSNYLVTTTAATVTIAPRSILVKMADTVKTYDGLSVQRDQVSYQLLPITEGMDEALADAQNESILSLSPRIDAGTYPDENTIELDILDGSGISVKHNYIIEVENADLTILKREVFLRMVEYTPIYDGKAHTSAKYEITNGSFVLEHEPLLTLHTENLLGEEIQAIEAGTYQNVLDSWEVLDNGNRVSDNYVLHIVDGVIWVQQRPIKVIISNQSKEYDDKPFVADTYVYECKPNQLSLATAIVEGQVAALSPLPYGEYVDADTYYDVLQGTLSVKAGEDDKTHNYSITYVDGDVTIEKRIVYVQVELISKIYDGIPVTPIEGSTYTVSESHPFIEGHTETLIFWLKDKNGKKVEALDVGEYTCGVQAISVVSADGRDVTHNYAPTATDNTLKIDYRPIKLTVTGATKIYNAEPFQASEIGCVATPNTNLIAEALSAGERVELQISAYVKVGEYKPTAKILRVDKDVTSNYKIEYEYAQSLKITKRDVAFNVVGKTATYSGEEIKDVAWSVRDGSLANGDDATIHVLTDLGASAVYVGEYTAFTATFVNAEGEDVTNCYTLGANSLNGVFTIEKREVVIQVDQMIKTYDGASFESERDVKWSLPTNALGKNDSIKLVITGIENCIDVGTYEREAWGITASVSDSLGADVSNNYEITCLYSSGGSLVILPRAVTVQPVNKVRPYDGTAFTSNACTAVGGTTLVKGHTVEATTDGSISWIGMVTNGIVGDVVIRDSAGNDVTHNYTVSKQNGTLQVVKREIYIIPLQLTRAYNGQTLVYPENFSASERAYARWRDEENKQFGTALYGGCYLQAEIEISDYIVDVGTVEVSILSCRIYDRYGNDVTDLYYDVVWRTTTASVTPKKLIISSNDVEKAYDGTALYGNAGDCHISKGSLVGNDTIEYEVKASITDVGTVVNQIVSVIIKDETGEIRGKYVCDEYGNFIEGNDSVHYNYSIQIDCGDLTIVESLDKEANG